MLQCQESKERNRRVVAVQIVSFFFVSSALHPYFGVRHDALLYTAQALHHFHATSLAGDLFFKFGSQDNFTCFTFFYAPLIEVFGIDRAHFAATVIGQCLWLSALFYFCSGIFRASSDIILAVFGAVVFNRAYGDGVTFSYWESFTTPRLYSEALVLISIGFYQRERFLGALLSGFGATFVHPLISLTGWLVLILLSLRRSNRVWLLVLSGLMCVSVLASFRIGPFARFFELFDEIWFAIVKERANVAIISEWPWIAVPTFFWSFSLLIMGYKFSSNEEFKVSCSIVIAAIIGCGITLLGEITRDVLLVNLQMYRCLWLFALVGNSWGVVILRRMDRDRQSIAYFFLLLGIFTNIVETFLYTRPVASAVFAVLAAFTLEWERLQLSNKVYIALFLIAGVAFAVFGIQLSILVPNLMRSEAIQGNQLSLSCRLLILIFGSVIATQTKLRPRFLVLVGLVTFILGTLTFDNRTPWTKFTESNGYPETLGDLLPQESNVYWESDDGLRVLWLKMRRESFYSCVQGAGVMFYRLTAYEYKRRSDVLSALNTMDFGDKSTWACRKKQNELEFGPSSLEQLRFACRMLPDLDRLVLINRIGGVPSEEWKTPVPFFVRKPDSTLLNVDSFHMYQCKDLR